jgi:hypothetical protein
VAGREEQRGSWCKSKILADDWTHPVNPWYEQSHCSIFNSNHLCCDCNSINFCCQKFDPQARVLIHHFPSILLEKSKHGLELMLYKVLYLFYFRDLAMIPFAVTALCNLVCGGGTK